MLIAVACVPLVIWIYLLLAHRGFWRVSRHFAPFHESSPGPATVVAVIPARNEAFGIERAVKSLLQQDFPGLMRIIVVDDNSEDGTGDLAHRAASMLGKEAHLTVLQGRALPPGWTGKMWAVSQGVAEAESFTPDYLLLT